MSKAENYIRKNTNQFTNEDGFDYIPWLTPDVARKAVEIAREETIKEVCEWIKYNNENGGCLFDGWENDLKKHLEDKLCEQ